jgi:hypothetical protein
MLPGAEHQTQHEVVEHSQDRWDLLDALQARGVMQRPGEARSADEIDDLAERLEQQGIR